MSVILPRLIAGRTPRLDSLVPGGVGHVVLPGCRALLSHIADGFGNRSFGFTPGKLGRSRLHFA